MSLQGAGHSAPKHMDMGWRLSWSSARAAPAWITPSISAAHTEYMQIGRRPTPCPPRRLSQIDMRRSAHLDYVNWSATRLSKWRRDR